jgi:hypothetical protein
MPTMSSYDLKVTGLLKPDADPARAAAAEADFHALFPTPQPGPSWSWDFVISYTTTLETATPISDEEGEIMVGSQLAATSYLLKNSVLNGVTLMDHTSLSTMTQITAETFLQEGSLLQPGTVLANVEYRPLLWRVGAENTAKWILVSGQIERAGNYRLLSFVGQVGVVRPGSLGHHWAIQTAKDDLKWFYTYRNQPWFKKLVALLIEFNQEYADVLAETVRIRDVKWYCGDGSGP